eukprot:CAMPEP_0203860984 /NCGR_PEP_ID=MMETSP0359-20131031/12746_1 /ASSEMBLY_ACC=CAM_ASM_000338 /TAXON_ID=268821 /ORGANISM="Scrippsiella Hangoei, Strain SHTV-5" /LENGTH=192 /DNA_ID=CAMNT_0050778147 /DNA_START=41 /DNA_END=620 /DNA_ORIENTATION=-
MATCERPLHKHVECVKGFLREARTHGLAYAPGSGGEDDRCKDTRQAYVDCRRAPPLKVEKEVNHMINTQAQPLDFYKHEPATGYMAKDDDSEHHTFMTRGPIEPPACQKELSMHGQCVENTLRNAMNKGTGYKWLPPSESESVDDMRYVDDGATVRAAGSTVAWPCIATSRRAGAQMRMPVSRTSYQAASAS